MFLTHLSQTKVPGRNPAGHLTFFSLPPMTRGLNKNNIQSARCFKATKTPLLSLSLLPAWIVFKHTQFNKR